jgi:hypothetical protein
MSGCNMLEQMNMQQHVRLQHSRTGFNIIAEFCSSVKLTIFMVSSLLHCQQGIHFLVLSAVGDSAKHFLALPVILLNNFLYAVGYITKKLYTLSQQRKKLFCYQIKNNF